MPMSAADAGEQQAFPEELRENGASRGADGFHDADVAGSLGDGDQHDIDDADGSEAESDDTHAAQEDIHGGEDDADGVRFRDGVELVEGVRERGIEAVALGNHAMHGDACGGIVVLDGGVVLDRSERILRDVVALEGEQLQHGGDGNEDLLVVVGIVAAADLLALADDREIDAVDADGLAERGTAGKEQ